MSLLARIKHLEARIPPLKTWDDDEFDEYIGKLDTEEDWDRLAERTLQGEFGPDAEMIGWAKERIRIQEWRRARRWGRIGVYHGGSVS